MNNDKMTTIIAADYMYLIFFGDDATITKIINKLNVVNITNVPEIENIKHKVNIKKDIYIKCEINFPCVHLLDDDVIKNILANDNKELKETKENIQQKFVIMDEGVETAQCLTFADISANENMMKIIDSKNSTQNNKIFMIMSVSNHNTYYKLGYPILQLDEEENPDKLISRWLKDNNIDDVVKELTIRPVNIVGVDHEILVFTAYVNN